ncbi:hypothetical protein NL526_29420, partial [Klebsiella pneumoniae]|nr:hypothetical protein [Klebsiella pneumoniae]
SARNADYKSVADAILSVLKSDSTAQVAAIDAAYMNGFGSPPSAASLASWQSKMSAGNTNYQSVIMAIDSALAADANAQVSTI